MFCFVKLGYSRFVGRLWVEANVTGYGYHVAICKRCYLEDLQLQEIQNWRYSFGNDSKRS